MKKIESTYQEMDDNYWENKSKERICPYCKYKITEEDFCSLGCKRIYYKKEE